MSTFVSLLFAAVAIGQGTDRLVSANVPAASAPLAIAELSRQIGYPLSAMPSTKNDILIISVDKVPIKTLMDKIVLATHGAWEPSEDGFRLIHNDATLRAEREEEYAHFLASVTDSLARMRKRVAEQGAFNAVSAEIAATRMVGANQSMRTGAAYDWRDYSNIQKLAPSYRVMSQILSNMGPETIAGVPRNRTIVFSTSPNRMQRKMPGELSGVIRQFIADQALWQKALKAAKQRLNAQDTYYDGEALDPTTYPVAKVLLKLSRSSQGPGQSVMVSLMVVDTKGRQIGNGSETLGVNWEDFGQEMEAAQKSASAQEESIKLSGNAKALMDSLRDAYSTSLKQGIGEPEINLSEDLRQLLAQPDKVEPLSIVASQVFMEMARILKVDLVACPPDEMTFVFNFIQSKEVKPSMIIPFARQMQVEMKSDAGWMVARPIESSYARINRIDRGALANYLRKAVKMGRIDLETKAAFTLSSGLEDETFLPLFFIQLLGLSSNSVYGGDWDSLRLYASLTPMQIRASKTGEPIPFRSLTPKQLEIIRHIVFDRPYNNLQVSWEDVPEDATGEEQMVFGEIQREATELLPNGFTGNEILTITDSTEDRVFGRPDAAEGRPSYGENALTADSIANIMFQKEHPEFFPWLQDQRAYNPTYSKFKVGYERNIQFVSQLTKKASLNMTLQDRMYTSKDAVPFEKLPAEFQKKVQEALVRTREAYKNQKPPNWNPGGGGATTVPPPSR